MKPLGLPGGVVVAARVVAVAVGAADCVAPGVAVAVPRDVAVAPDVEAAPVGTVDADAEAVPGAAARDEPLWHPAAAATVTTAKVTTMMFPDFLRTNRGYG